MKNLLLLTLIFCELSIASKCNQFFISKVPTEIRKNIVNSLTKNINTTDEILSTVKSAIAPFGYVNSKVKLLNCSLSINLGQPTRVRINKSNKLIPNIPGFKDDDIFSSKTYTKAINWLYKHFKSLGYRDVDLSQSEIIINPSTNTANIDFNIELGKKYVFGNITFETEYISNELIQRYFTIKLGDPYSSIKLQEIENNLRKSGYFKSVQLTAMPEHNNEIPIRVKTVLSAKTQILAGLGYDSLNSIKAIFNSRTIANRLGHIMSSITSISQNISNIQLQYLIPGNKPQEEKYIAQAIYSVEKILDKKDTSANLSFSYNRKNEFASIIIGINAIRNKQSDSTQDINTNILYPYGHIERNSSYVNKKNLITYQWSASSLLAKKGFLSSIDIAQLKFKYRSKIPLSNEYRVVVSSQLGINWTNDPTRQPLPILLTLGGNNSLRGYPYNSIINRTDKLQILRALSLEIQKKIANNIYGTTFIDMGQISQDLTKPLLKGIGVGATYSTDIGDVNFSVAKPLDQPPDGSSKKIRFSVSYTM